MPDEYVKGGDTLGAVVRNEKTGEKSVAVDLYRHFDALLKKGSVDPEVARHVHQLRHLCNEALKDRAKLMGQVKTLKKRDIPRLEEQLAAREATIDGLQERLDREMS